tara:strand:- start:1123 stop:1503 length:381 start_codon:yes stop_codon:yes gene_type:complete
MLSRTGLLIALVLVAMLVAGCGGVKAKYENTASVISAAEKHKIDSCRGGYFQIVGANDLVACDFNDSSHIEIYTFDGDAKISCAKNHMCEQMFIDPLSVRFTNNAMIWLPEQPESVRDALIADIED